MCSIVLKCFYHDHNNTLFLLFIITCSTFFCWHLPSITQLDLLRRIYYLGIIAFYSEIIEFYIRFIASDNSFIASYTRFIASYISFIGSDNSFIASDNSFFECGFSFTASLSRKTLPYSRKCLFTPKMRITDPIFHSINTKNYMK